MKMRMLQISCLIVLGLAAGSLPAGARPLWDDCVGDHCWLCEAPDAPNSEGNLSDEMDYCYVGPGSGEEETCQYYGCSAFNACGEDYQYAQCKCQPCPGVK